MNHRSVVLILLASSLSVGCMGIQSGAGGPGYSTPQASKDTLRAQEKAGNERTAKALDERMDKLEADAAKAMKMALGQEAVAVGQPMPAKVTESIPAFRKAKFELRLETVKDQNGNAVNRDFFMLKDSFTDRVPALSRKIGEGKATPAEIKFVQGGSKHIAKLNDLRSQVRTASMAAMMANDHMQTSSLSTMMQIAGMQRARKQLEMELNDDDYVQIQGILVRHKRAEAVAGASLGFLAAYQAVLNKKRDPKALELIAEASLTAFEQEPEVSVDDAREYVKNLKGNILIVQRQYEAMMIAVHGKEKYEAQYKAGIDGIFRQANQAHEQKSASEIAEEEYARWKKDNPEMAALQAAATSGSSGGGLGLGGLTGGLGSMFPAFAVVEASLVGLEALANGDPKAAIDAAIQMVPASPAVKGGLSAASDLLFS